jgi:hypothetical protein
MVDEPASLQASEGADERFQAGDRVRVVLGVLSGLSGVVVRSISGHRYLLSIDGLDEGVHVVVKRIALQRVIAP